MPCRSILAAALLVLPALAGHAAAQECDSLLSQTTLAALSGRRIAAVDVVTASPDPFRGLAAALDRIHVRTRTTTIRRQLLFAAGDTVDTLRVGESMRRLRALRYLGAVSIRGTWCGDDAPVSLTVLTRDAWSTKAGVRIRSASSSAFGVTERNVLGSGREASLNVKTDGGRLGIGATWRDPWVAGGRLTTEVGSDAYRDGSDYFVTVARREHSIADRWGFEAAAERSVRDAAIPDGDLFRRARGRALVSRRATTSPDAVTSLVAGIEHERISLVAAAAAPVIGPARVRRDFTGLAAGIVRRSVAYDTVTWLLGNDRLVDIPLALEMDAVVALGEERTQGAPAAHVDLWAGRMWMPTRNAMVTGDLWASGYRTTRLTSAATVRASVAAFAPARRGLWIGRLAAEQMFDPDPDVRSLGWSDVTLPVLPPSVHVARAAAGGSLERTLRLRPLTRSWTLEGAAFGGFSARRGAFESAHEHVYAGVVGLGLRLAPTRAGRASARLDIGLPILRSPEVSSRPYIAVSVSPWFAQMRRRDGRAVR